MLSDALKYPTQYLTEHALARHIWSGYPSSSHVTNVAQMVIFGALAVVFSPVWLAGDMLEWYNGSSTQFHSPFEVPRIKKEVLPAETKLRGFSLSTFQNSKDATFCGDSNWAPHRDVSKAPDECLDILDDRERGTLLDKMVEAGANTLRISIEMSDVMPNRLFNGTGFQKYSQVIDEVIDKGLTPIVTLSHFVHPEVNFWLNDNCVERFSLFAKEVATMLTGRVQYYVTFNEPNVDGVMNYVMGRFPAKTVASPFDAAKACSNMYQAHIAAYKEIQNVYEEEDVKVGMTHQAIHFYADSRFNYPARIAAFVMQFLFHDSFMRWAMHHQEYLDFLGIQYYSRPLIGGFPPKPVALPGQKMVDAMEYRFDPEGIAEVVEEASQKLPRVSLMVTEAGTPLEDSKGEYFAKSLAAIRDCSAKVLGYLAWTITPNFEWDKGFSENHNFGVIETDGFDVLNRWFHNSANEVPA